MLAYRYTKLESFKLVESALIMGVAALIASVVNFMLTIILAFFGIMLGSTLGTLMFDMYSQGNIDAVSGSVICVGGIFVIYFIMGAIGSLIASFKKREKW